MIGGFFHFLRSSDLSLDIKAHPYVAALDRFASEIQPLEDKYGNQKNAGNNPKITGRVRPCVGGTILQLLRVISGWSQKVLGPLMSSWGLL